MGFEVLLTMPQRHRPEGDHHPSTSTTPGTTSDLAAMAGTRRQTVSKPLKDAEAAGAITIGRGRITITDRTLLDRLAL